MSKKYNNIIFDIDGTLWNSTDIVAKAWIESAKAMELPYEHISGERLSKEFGKPMNEIFDSLFPGKITDDILEKVSRDFYEREHDFLERNESDISYKDMVKTIKELSKTKKLYIVSNCQCGYIDLVCRKCNISEFFKDSLCFGDTNTPKHETIKTLMKRNNISTDDTCYVGDTMGDCNSSHLAGIDFILADWGFGDVTGAEHTVKSFNELYDLLIDK